jgi:hypothetical protein
LVDFGNIFPQSFLRDVLIQDVAEYWELILSSGNQYKDYENRFIGYNHFVAMFEQNGVVEMALK